MCLWSRSLPFFPSSFPKSSISFSQAKNAQDWATRGKSSWAWPSGTAGSDGRACIVSLDWLATCLVLRVKNQDLKDKRFHHYLQHGQGRLTKMDNLELISELYGDTVASSSLKRLMRTFHVDLLPAEAWSISLWAKYKVVGRTDPQINMTHYSWESTFKLASAF